MKRGAWVLLLSAAAGGAGCFPADAWLTPPPPTPRAEALPLPTRPPVGPDEVTDTNAPDILHALSDELDRENGARPADAAPPPPAAPQPSRRTGGAVW
jgi:hypothetical protein